MKLKSISLKNFRRFSEFKIDFDEKVTVIIARNGKGKTSILDAATMALGTFVGAFDYGKAKHIEKSDARYVRQASRGESEQQFPVVVRCDLFTSGQNFHVERHLTGLKNKTTIKEAAALTAYGNLLQKSVRELQDSPLPVIAYYGTGRLWKAHKNMTKKAVLSESRTMGYEDCLSSSSSFVQVQQWMAKASIARIQQSEMPAAYPTSDIGLRLRAIQGAVDEVLKFEGWSNFHYSVLHEELAMFHPDSGVLPVSLLSDGVRAMVSLVADLAFRCARLNGHLGESAAKESEGIAFIDEVDIHLHPAWQQRVIQSLIDAFPKLQFIVTTHSPQVLTTVDSKCIRIIELQNVSLSDSDGVNSPDGAELVASTMAEQTHGLPSADVLAIAMNTNPVPPVEPARQLSEYRGLIQKGEHESVRGSDLRRALEKHFGLHHQVLQECDRMIRLEAIKKRFPKGTPSSPGYPG